MQERHEPVHGASAWRWHWALPLCPIAASMFCLSALVYYHTVLQGTGEAWGFFQGLVIGLYRWFGFVPTFMFWLLVFAWCSVWFVTGRFDRPWVRTAWMGAFALSLAVLVNLGTDAAAPPPHAGIVGTFLAVRLVSVLGLVFSALLTLAAALASLFLATDFLFYRHFEALARGRGVAEPGVEPEATAAFRELALAGAYGDEPRVRVADGEPAAPRRRLVLDGDDDLPPASPIAAEVEVPGDVELETASAPAVESPTSTPGTLDAAREQPETEEFDGPWAATDEPAEFELPVDVEDGSSPPEGQEEPPSAEPVVELTPVAPRQRSLFVEAAASEPASAQPLAEPAADSEPTPYELPRPAPDPVAAEVDTAAREVLAAGRASVLLLRRRLGCSSARAQAILDQLRLLGVVDGAEGSAQGNLLTTLAQWESR